MTVRRRLATAMAVVLAFALSACAGLPVGGPVHVGKAIDEVEGPPDFSYVPDGPGRDATPQQIVEGFIAAGSGPRGNWEVAQEFLTSSFKQKWQPQAGVTVYTPGESSISSPADDEIVFTVQPVANVDATGSYQPAEEGRIPFTFSLEKEQGQWRISQAPDGIVLDANRFGSVFQSYDLSYFDPSWRVLIPDVRWFPSTNPATRITAALVSGTQSPWLGESVRSAFTGEVTLTQPSVPVESGIAQISFDPSIRDLSRETLARMKAQLDASLAGAGILDVQMLVGDEPLDVTARTTRSTAVDTRPLVLKNGTFGFLSGSDIDEVAGFGEAFSEVEAEAVETDAARTTAAVRTRSGAILRVDSDGTRTELDTRPGMTAPSIDPYGYIWTVPGDQPTEVVAYGRDGSAQKIPAGWVGAAGVTAMRVSRDGARVAALVRAGGRWSVWVAGIIRDKDGAPTSIGDPLVVANIGGRGIDLTWIDGSTVALVFADGQQRVVREQTVGGLGTEVRAPDGVVAIAGGNQSGSVRLLTKDGSLYVQRGSWQVLAADVSVLAVQQGQPG
ncbi:LpqB family beta-propeller domain-containing protein [Microbacterium aquilitoris]|uniref:LpqB family beta-propeller domain-containing protein n=1 Tax=Microbacterium aquilitoris TaxID=3067307 RepID=UPI002891C195|nr:LpqB family beta-propeller domain-containing protein [Microbacterium sp. KSW2-22]MDT3344666.1 LpqB family beta-propeller domain-containing protein [Microbacterium sp. KSW2-22]